MLRTRCFSICKIHPGEIHKSLRKLQVFPKYCQNQPTSRAVINVFLFLWMIPEYILNFKSPQLLGTPDEFQLPSGTNLNYHAK